MRNRILILKISISGKRYNSPTSEQIVKGTGRNTGSNTGNGGVKTTRILSKNMTQKRSDMTTAKIRPIRAPFPQTVSGTLPENPEDRSFSVPVENTLKLCSVWQNTADFHLPQRPPKALKPCRFLPLILPHPGTGKAAGTRI
jgi:hypothetical protein